MEQKEQKQKPAQEHKSQRGAGPKTEGRKWRFFEKCTRKYLENIRWKMLLPILRQGHLERRQMSWNNFSDRWLSYQKNKLELK